MGGKSRRRKATLWGLWKQQVLARSVTPFRMGERRQERLQGRRREREGVVSLALKGPLQEVPILPRAQHPHQQQRKTRRKPSFRVSGREWERRRGAPSLIWGGSRYQNFPSVRWKQMSERMKGSVSLMTLFRYWLTVCKVCNQPSGLTISPFYSCCSQCIGAWHILCRHGQRNKVPSSQQNAPQANGSPFASGGILSVCFSQNGSRSF